jgi:hypothetical protein
VAQLRAESPDKPRRLSGTHVASVRNRLTTPPSRHGHQQEKDMRDIIKKVVCVGAAAVAVLMCSGTPAHARQSSDYRFTTLIDSLRDGLEPTRCAAINTRGTVAVTVVDTVTGLTKIVTKRRAHDAPVVIADNASVPDFPTLCDNGFNSLPSDPSINELDEVAFQGNTRRLTTRPECGIPPQTARRQGVFLGKGGPLTTIAHSVNPPGGSFISEFLVADQSVNSSGRVAMVPELDVTFDHGLFVGSKSGTFDRRFLVDTPTPNGFNFNNLSSRVSLNELGQIAFESGLNDRDVAGIFLSNPDGTFRTIVDNSTGLAASDPSLNILGRVAFTANRFDDDSNQIFSVNTSRGGPITTIAESSPGGYASFNEPSLNDFGQVAFTADVQPDEGVFTTVQGVFTGGDPVADKVLQAGDVYEGVTVTGVVTCAEALNNLGQIAMTVFSEDPGTFEVRSFIVRATPRRLRDLD